MAATKMALLAASLALPSLQRAEASTFSPMNRTATLLLSPPDKR